MAYAGELSLKEHAPHAELVIVSPNDPAAMERMPKECREAGVPFIFDPSQQTIRMTGEQIMTGITGSRLVTNK